MDKTVGRVAVAPTAAGAGARTQSPEPAEPAEQQQPASHLAARLQGLCGACLRAAAAALVSYSLVAAAWRVRHDPRELAFVAGAGSLLSALFACLRRAERLAPEAPAGERRRVHAAAWALSTALSGALACRVAAVMPPALAVLVWTMTVFVALAGLFLLVLCSDQRYQALGDADCDATKPLNKINPADGLV